MVTVNDFIENKNNENCMIAIEEARDKEQNGTITRTLYEGLLYDIPEELRGREVIKEGFAIVAQRNVLTVSGDWDF